MRINHKVKASQPSHAGGSHCRHSRQPLEDCGASCEITDLPAELFRNSSDRRTQKYRVLRLRPQKGGHQEGQVARPWEPYRSVAEPHALRAGRREVPSFHWLKSLDPSAPVGLGHVDIALGIDRQSVAMGKFTDLVTRTPEA